MNRKENSHSVGDILRNLHDFVQEDGEEIKSMSLKKINDELLSAKINIDRPGDKVLAIFATVKAKESLVNAAEERLRLLKRFQSSVHFTKYSLEETRESLIVLANKILGKEQALAYCRKFENATKEDLQTLITDLMFLTEAETKSRDDLGK